MKKLTGLDKPVLDLFGKPITERRATDKACGSCQQPIWDTKEPTIGQFLAASISNEGNADDPLKSMKVALKIHDSSQVDLEDAEFELAESAFKKAGYTALIMAAVLKCLKAAEERAVTEETLPRNGAKARA